MCLPPLSLSHHYFLPNLSLLLSIIHSPSTDRRAPPTLKWPDASMPPQFYRISMLPVFCSYSAVAGSVRRTPALRCTGSGGGPYHLARPCPAQLAPLPQRPVLLGDEIPSLAPLLLRDNALPCPARLGRCAPANSG
jgi:hypothetical protein